jgi:hypothetical protein
MPMSLRVDYAPPSSTLSEDAQLAMMPQAEMQQLALRYAGQVSQSRGSSQEGWCLWPRHTLSEQPHCTASRANEPSACRLPAVKRSAQVVCRCAHEWGAMWVLPSVACERHQGLGRQTAHGLRPVCQPVGGSGWKVVISGSASSRALHPPISAPRCVPVLQHPNCCCVMQSTRAEMKEVWRDGQTKIEKLKASVATRLPLSWPEKISRQFFLQMEAAVTAAWNGFGVTATAPLRLHEPEPHEVDTGPTAHGPHLSQDIDEQSTASEQETQ